MNRKPLIGIVGGMGPYAGLDLARKIFDQTVAQRDQDHLPLSLISFSGSVEDRTDFLLGNSTNNPVDGIFSSIEKLELLGATVAGIACNTAHASIIFDELLSRIRASGFAIRLIHMIEEVATFIEQEISDASKIGVLATTGSVKAKLFPHILEPKGYTILSPEDTIQHTMVHDAIYNPAYGIKAHSDPIHPSAREKLLQAIDHLRQKGADAIILGCTEIPLAITVRMIDEIPLIDPAFLLARALIRETYPDKLVPLDQSTRPQAVRRLS